LPAGFGLRHKVNTVAGDVARCTRMVGPERDDFQRHSLRGIDTAQEWEARQGVLRRWMNPKKALAQGECHKMRKVLALVLAPLVLVSAVSPADAKKILRLTLQLPLRTALGQNLVMFKEEVEAATKGEIEVQIFDSAQLVSDKDVPKAVGSGQLEMGVASLARFSSDVPAVDIFSLPFLFDTDEKRRAAVAPDSPVRRPIDEAIVSKLGCRVLWWQTYASTVLLSNGSPIREPRQIAGRKVRVFGKQLATWVSSLGGTPVAIAGSEQYLAYKHGTATIGITGLDSVKSGKLWEVMDTVNLVKIAATEFVVLINEKVLEEMTDEEREIVTTAAHKAEAKLRESSQVERDIVDVLIQNKMNIYLPTPSEMAEWRKSNKAAREEFLKTSGELGRQVYEAAIKFD
jgi:C4-dicarboxylate-binding protein DctP